MTNTEEDHMALDLIGHGLPILNRMKPELRKYCEHTWWDKGERPICAVANLAGYSTYCFLRLSYANNLANHVSSFRKAALYAKGTLGKMIEHAKSKQDEDIPIELVKEAGKHLEHLRDSTKKLGDAMAEMRRAPEPVLKRFGDDTSNGLYDAISILEDLYKLIDHIDYDAMRDDGAALSVETLETLLTRTQVVSAPDTGIQSRKWESKCGDNRKEILEIAMKDIVRWNSGKINANSQNHLHQCLEQMISMAAVRVNMSD